MTLQVDTGATVLFIYWMSIEKKARSLTDDSVNEHLISGATRAIVPLRRVFDAHRRQLSMEPEQQRPRNKASPPAPSKFLGTVTARHRSHLISG